MTPIRRDRPGPFCLYRAGPTPLMRMHNKTLPCEPKVFDLTGMSAAEVGSMVSAVSQATVGTLEHDAAAWDLYDRCRRTGPDDSERDSDSDE